MAIPMQKWQNNLRLGAFVAAVVCMLVGFAGMYFRLRFVFSDMCFGRSVRN